MISDEAHRTQVGPARAQHAPGLAERGFHRLHRHAAVQAGRVTKRIFGGYVSRYDFKRSEEDGATVKLVYENRGEKLGVARLDLNNRIAEAIEEAELDPDQEALLDKLLGKDYEVITADDRLDKIAADFVEHCATRWESGKCDAGLHRQDHLRPHVSAHHAALAGEGSQRFGTPRVAKQADGAGHRRSARRTRAA